MEPFIRTLATYRLPIGTWSKSVLRPSGVFMPQSYGSASSTDLLLSVVNGAYETADRYGVPMTTIPSFSRLLRGVSLTSPANTFHAQMAFPDPPPPSAVPIFRCTPMVPSFCTTVGLSSVQTGVTKLQPRYLALDPFGIRDERIKYTKEKTFSDAWRLGQDPGIDWLEANEVFGDLSLYQYRLLGSLRLIDTSATSEHFREIMRIVEDLDPVRKALEATRFSSLEEALVDPYDHTVAQGFSLAFRWLEPDVSGLLFTSAQGKGGHGRDLVVLHGAAKQEIPGIEPESRLDFRIKGGHIDVTAEAPPLDSHSSLDKPPIVLGASAVSGSSDED